MIKDANGDISKTCRCSGSIKTNYSCLEGYDGLLISDGSSNLKILETLPSKIS
jgi:hypothetical protein